MGNPTTQDLHMMLEDGRGVAWSDRGAREGVRGVDRLHRADLGKGPGTSEFPPKQSNGAGEEESVGKVTPGGV